MDLGEEHRTPVGDGTGAIAAMGAVFAAVAVMASVDLISDMSQGTGWAHLALEGALALVGLVGLAVVLRRVVALTRRTRSLGRQTATLEQRLAASAAEATRWRQEAKDVVAGLGAAMDRQFARWGLTPAEAEVALLLLKGLSHKEVASVREVTEATARQQATAVYRKAGLTGRNELAAFFLEDLTLPARRAEGGEHAP